MFGFISRVLGNTYLYKVRFTDSLDTPEVYETEISSPSPISKSEAEEVLKEQLNANNLYPEWVRIVTLTQT
jgi:hypothetical protein